MTERRRQATVREVADYVGITPPTVRKAIHEGLLVASRPTESATIRISWEAVDRWLEESRVTGPAEVRDGRRKGKRPGRRPATV